MNNLHTSPPKFLQKPSPPYFFMVHLLHRLYGVDAPDVTKSRHCQRMYGASTVNLLH